MARHGKKHPKRKQQNICDTVLVFEETEQGPYKNYVLTSDRLFDMVKSKYIEDNDITIVLIGLLFQFQMMEQEDNLIELFEFFDNITLKNINNPIMFEVITYFENKKDPKYWRAEKLKNDYEMYTNNKQLDYVLK